MDITQGRDMTTTSRALTTGAALFLALLATPSLRADDAPATSPATTQPAEAEAKKSEQLVTINREAGYVEMDAKVIHREADWLELLACTPGGREHEAVLTIAAKPRQIHMAMLVLGLEPGKPLSWKQVGEGYVMTPPSGPKVNIAIRYEKDGKLIEVPASNWIMDRNTKKPMADEPWLFTGSKFAEVEGKQFYMADLNGTTISLVNFGDDLLTRAGEMTDRSDNERWACNTDQIPEAGTVVKVRLTPVKEDKKDVKVEPTTQPTTQPAGE
jgi:hypothetical protein